MENVINNIECRILELEEIKEIEVMSELDSTSTSNKIQNLEIEKRLFKQFPELLTKIKDKKLKRIKFISLSL